MVIERTAHRTVASKAEVEFVPVPLSNSAMDRSMSDTITRRGFVKSAAIGMAALSTTRAVRAAAANERIGVGLIGLGNRGDALLRAFHKNNNVSVTALCDVYAPHLNLAAELVGGDVMKTNDYRRLLDNKDVNAVVIASPDHWHALQFIDACEAGKDVYVEKPLSLTVDEGQKMVEAARRTGRITQMGVHFRSSSHGKEGCKLIRDGGIGQVTSARCYHLSNEFPMGIGDPPDCDPPPDLDWDLWLGPAAKVPYNPNYCLYKFRWFYPYSGGQVTNFGTHWIDLIQWAIGKEAPVAVTALGGNYAVKDNRMIPDTCEIIWEYDGGPIVSFTQIDANAAPGNLHGSWIEIRGTKGTAYFSAGKMVIESESNPLHPFPALSPLHRKEDDEIQAAKEKAIADQTFLNSYDPTTAHVNDFVDSVKSRKPTVCPVEVGHRSTSTTLIGNIALRTRKHLQWDASLERFTNDEEANRFLSYEYRKPWTLA
jgi:predicted dehydrogenase